MKTAPQPLLEQSSALSAFFDAMLYPQGSQAVLPAVAADAGCTEPGATKAPLSTASQSDAIRALLFEVAGLTLALPLETVVEVIQDGYLKEAVSTPCATFIGTLTRGDSASTIVDTARLVLPADRAGRLAADASERARCLIVIADGRWSLACSGVGEVVALDRAAIKWRTAEGKRPWLAGMVTGRQCALLDVAGLTGVLAGQMA